MSTTPTAGSPIAAAAVQSEMYSPVTGQRMTCTDGGAAGFRCRNVDLMSFLPISEIGGGAGTRLNDIWGWTDPLTGDEYALVGRTDGTAFVNVTDPENPVFVGSLPFSAGVRPDTLWRVRPSTWRDIKVYRDHAFIVADGSDHGMQVFDLTRLRSVAAPPVEFTVDTLYTGVRNAHNIAINEETGYAYIVGSQPAKGVPGTCTSGLHMVDIRDPQRPTLAGCYRDEFSRRGYTHDTQCIIYRGPDLAYSGREICVSSNETAVVISDVTDKTNPTTIGVGTYPETHYAHQGWLTPNHVYFLLDDELDEIGSRNIERTRTLVWDLKSLEDPQLVKQYLGTSTSTDHNQYIVEDRAFQANYKSGLRILDISTVANPVEVGFFDTYTPDDTTGFQGAWSNYPFFQSGTVVVSSIGEGLFVLRPTGPAKTAIAAEEVPGEFTLHAAYPNPFNPETTITLDVERPQNVRVSVFDVQGKEVAVLFAGSVSAGPHALVFDAAGLASGVYLVRAAGETASRTLAVTLQK